MASRRFTEKQLADVMRKAAEIQARESTTSGNEGVSEQEFRAAAHELGIGDPAIDAALAELEVPDSIDRAGIWGGPFRRDVEGVFEGQITDEKWEMIVADLRRTFGEAGSINRRGSTYEWVGTGGGVDNNTITVRQSGGSIRVDVSSEFGGYGFLGYLLMLLPLFISIGFFSTVHMPILWTLAILLGWIFVLLFTARSMAVRLGKKRDRKLGQILRSVATMISADSTEPSTSTGLKLPSVEGDERQQIEIQH